MAQQRDYLKRRGDTWYVHVQIPAHLRQAAGGKWEYIKSLKTGDLPEANKRKAPIIAAFKRQIAALGKPRAARAVLSEIYDRALALREMMERHKGEVLYEEPDGTPYYATDEYIDHIADEADRIVARYGDKAGGEFFKIAKGEGTLLSAQLDGWLVEQAGVITEQTIAHHRTTVNAFIAWAGEGILIEEVDRRKAGEYVRHLLSETSGLSRRTVGRYVSSLSSFWTWLEARGLAEANPWRGHGLGKKSARGVAKKGSQWTDDALVKVLTASYTPRYTEIFHDLVKLALVTGARLDELCALKVGDVQKREDGWWISVREGKSEAAVRDIPLHDSAVHVVTRRLKHAKTFVFEGLIPGGPDHKRSWHVSKAFGRFTKQLELGEKRQTFHALRKTFIEVLEGAEVPESTVKLIVGHARQSMTFGHYSKGQRVQLRDAINKLRYSSAVMKLISAEGSAESPNRKGGKHGRADTKKD